MSTFAFESITAAQALAIAATDTLTFAQASGPSTGVTVIYTGDQAGDISIGIGARTVIFGSGVSLLSQNAGSLTFADGSQLYVGNGASNVYNELTFNPPSSGAIAAAFGGDGDDILAVNGAHTLLQGNAGNDNLTGNNGDDTIYGGQGNDFITVGTGANFGQGNKGDDTISGSGTDDTLLGGQGDDSINGAGTLDGNLGNDTITGAGQLLGEAGDDRLTSTGATNNTVVGGDGNDTLAANGTGADTLAGGNGDDSIVAGAGADSITGDAGNDTISVSGHAERIAGGAGADVFIFNTGTTAVGTVPAITDWSASQDKIRFAGYTPNPSDYTSITDANYATAVTDATRLITQNHFTFVGVQVGADVVIFAGGAGGITSAVDLVGRSLADFDPHNNLI